MTDDQLRAVIRDAVARHLAGNAQSPPPPVAARAPEPVAVPRAVPGWTPPSAPPPISSGNEHAAQSVTNSALAPGAVTIASAPGGIAVAAAPGSVVHLHISHATFALPAALDGAFDGPCRTEPHAGCTSCGFCQSLGY